MCVCVGVCTVFVCVNRGVSVQEELMCVFVHCVWKLEYGLQHSATLALQRLGQIVL